MFNQYNTNNFGHIIILPITIFNRIWVLTFFSYIYIYIVLLFLFLSFSFVGFYVWGFYDIDFYKMLILDFGYLDFYSLDYWLKNYRFIPFFFFYIFNLEYTYLSIVGNSSIYIDSIIFSVSQITFVFESLIPRITFLLNNSLFYNYFAFKIENNFFLWFSLEYFFPYFYDNSFLYIDYRKKVFWLWSHLKYYGSFDFTPMEYVHYRISTWRWLKAFPFKFLSTLYYYNLHIFSWFDKIYFLYYDPKNFTDPVSLLEGNFLYVNQIKDANWHLHRTIIRLNHILSNINYSSSSYQSESLHKNFFLINIINSWKFSNKIDFNFINYLFLFELLYIKYYLVFIHYYNNIFIIICFIVLILYFLYFFIFKFISVFWLLDLNDSLWKVEQDFFFIYNFKVLHFDFYFVLKNTIRDKLIIFFNILILLSMLFYVSNNYIMYIESKILFLYYICFLFNFLDLYIYIFNNNYLFFLFLIVFIFFCFLVWKLFIKFIIFSKKIIKNYKI